MEIIGCYNLFPQGLQIAILLLAVGTPPAVLACCRCHWRLSLRLKLVCSGWLTLCVFLGTEEGVRLCKIARLDHLPAGAERELLAAVWIVYGPQLLARGAIVLLSSGLLTLFGWLLLKRGELRASSEPANRLPSPLE